jgi:hypothetical protein
MRATDVSTHDSYLVLYLVLKVALYLRRLVAGFLPRRPGFEFRSGFVRFVVNKVALGKVSSEHFGFPYQF